MTTYVVGDIQGCYRGLMDLVEKIEFDQRKDQLWSLGDMINRGPDSLRVLEYCQSLGSAFNSVLGNHELHFIAVARGHKRINRGDTIAEILDSPKLEEHTHWLRQQNLLLRHEDTNSTLVHAGIPPQWEIEDAVIYANEIEEILRDDKKIDLYLSQMYGNQPSLWKNELSGPDRWRLITNYLTRMRFCTQEGTLDLQAKGPIKAAPKDHLPWFQARENVGHTDIILFGHWASLMGNTHSRYAHALDTGYVWGETLTAVAIVNPNIRLSVAAPQ